MISNSPRKNKIKGNKVMITMPARRIFHQKGVTVQERKQQGVPIAKHKTVEAIDTKALLKMYCAKGRRVNKSM
jgi:hypothetical protein